MRRGRTGAGGPLLSPAASLERRRARGRRTALLVLVCLCAALAGAVWAHRRTADRAIWTVRAVEVAGNRSLSTAELLDRLGLQPGVPWWKVARGSVDRLLREEPRMSRIGVRWDWPRDLRVEVDERESQLRIPGRPTLDLTSDGVLVETRADLDPPDLPLLTGALPVARRPGARVDLRDDRSGWKEILELTGRDSPLRDEISEVHSCGDRLFQIFLRSGRQVILWEAGRNEEIKRQLPAVIDELRADGVDDAVLDLRFHDQLVVRRAAADVDTAEVSGSQEAHDGSAAPGGARARSQEEDGAVGAAVGVDGSGGSRGSDGTGIASGGRRRS